MALCRYQGGACERATDHPSGLCSLHRPSRFKLVEPFGKQKFLRWYETYQHASPEAVAKMLDAFVQGSGTDAEKLQFIRDEVAAGRK